MAAVTESERILLARLAELELALVDLYNLCMANGWGTSPMVREMLAARRALRNE